MPGSVGSTGFNGSLVLGSTGVKPGTFGITVSGVGVTGTSGLVGSNGYGTFGSSPAGTPGICGIQFATFLYT